ncbi:hypothetical protein [Chryseobacterium candidae]|jgi:hypothetical protein|uniref:DUF4468 domain-containing protein n=1 Tax=Chryseobacterium candidae TaxID=1978493 RepID=A0ABY2R8F1_9FLAO|nr:hypothetical protein [Chryseobacterium candidae]THV61881.1 hypothetical protein EK417_08195 [Chryseobacterium candidae]
MKNRFLHGFFIIWISLSSAYAQKSGGQVPVFFTTKAQDTVKIGETLTEKDTTGSKSLKNRIKPIQANFKSINSVTKWTSVKKKDIEGESAEGGEATFYYTDKGLEKVIARHYGEMGQMLIEYYLMNGQLSFVFEKEYRYNRPLFYDTKAMKENNDMEAFDLKKSKVIMTRNYFENGNIIMITNTTGRGFNISADYPYEQEKNLTESFKKLLKLAN